MRRSSRSYLNERKTISEYYGKLGNGIVSVKSVILWILRSNIVLEIYRGFGGTFGFPFQNRDYKKINLNGTAKRTSDPMCGVLCYICGEIIKT